MVVDSQSLVRSALALTLGLGAGCYTGLHGGASGGEAGGDSGEVADGASDGGSEDGSTGVPSCDPNDPDGGDGDDELADFMEPTRVLRRITIVLAGRFPRDDEYAELLALTAAEQEPWLQTKAAALMEEPEFYAQMLDLGREWIAMPMLPGLGNSPNYGGHQAAVIQPCDDDTVMAGAWTTRATYCSGIDDADDSPVAVRSVEPWWAEGTQIDVLADGGKPDAFVDGVDCGSAIVQNSGVANVGCGCGPNLAYCYPTTEAGESWNFEDRNPDGGRRLLWEEPARLLAHIAWHDLPFDDLIVGDYSVGPARVRAAYVRWARRTGALQMDDEQTWWRGSGWSSATDPHHDTTDPNGWGEFEISAVQPYLLSDRDVRFDPRVDPRGALEGIPSAGVLTTVGMLGAYPRERVRAARMLETFACETFAPPPGDIEFAPYEIDAATSGTCQHCHLRIDPAAIHFKRIQISHAPLDGYNILGVGNWQPAPEWNGNSYPWHRNPWPRMVRSFVADTRMTPVSAAASQADSYSLFIDFLPEDQTLLGTTGDGTIGPLGFGKIVKASGAFDRCAVRRIHERIVGRDLDPTTESGYLDALVDDFVAGGRLVKPFIAALVASESFHRGI